MCVTFTPNNDGQKGYLGYTGLKSCDIRYDPTDFEWELSTFGSKERLFWAVSGASKESALLGTHDWTIYNDSRECTGELEFKTRLTLTACSEQEFTCTHGICVDMVNRCDGKVDCTDKSDEIGCNIIMADSSYNKEMNPSPLKQRKKAEIAVSVEIKAVLGIDEIDQSFHLSYQLTSTWKDPRLTYHNLKKNSNLNVLSMKEQASIWTPKLILANTKATETISQDKDTLTKVIANSNFSYSVADITSLQNIYIFKGQENSIEM